MVERKDQLRNVAFGGNWSEEILVVDELNRVLVTVEKAADECRDRDVLDDELLAAMQYVEHKIEKGAMLKAAFFGGLKIQDQSRRRVEAMRVSGMIRTWAGM